MIKVGVRYYAKTDGISVTAISVVRLNFIKWLTKKLSENGTKYSRVDQVKFVEDHTPSNFVKALLGPLLNILSQMIW